MVRRCVAASCRFQEETELVTHAPLPRKVLQPAGAKRRLNLSLFLRGISIDEPIVVNHSSAPQILQGGTQQCGDVHGLTRGDVTVC